MVDFVLGRLRFKFKGDWAISTAYLRDDVITYGGRSYVCLTNHTSSSNASGGFYSDASRWELMTDGTEWKNTWATSTYYKVNDLVKFGSRIYICSNGHTSNAAANSGFYSDSANWQLYADGYQNVQTWTPSTYYKVNDIVKFGARLYLANTGHTANSTANAGFYSDGSKWQLLNDGMENRGTWSPVTYYRVNDIVKWGSSVYICNTGHTSSPNWVDSESNFALLVGGLEFEDSYSNVTLYQPGDIVRYGGYQFVATNEAQNILPTNTSYWLVLSTGFNHEGDYNNGTTYQPGDIVRYGAYTYVAKLDSTGNIPTNTTYWNLLNQGTRWIGDYDNGTAYVPGDLVRWGGYTYQALLNTTGQTPHSNTSAWARQVTGFSWKDNFNNGFTYQLGDVVRWNGSSWISTTNNNIGITPDTSSNTNWSILVQGSANNVLNTEGDLLYQSSSGLSRLPIGANGQVLAVYAGIPVWEDNSYANNVFYVSPTGTDNASFGKTPQRPFKTIKYATGHVANTAGAGTRTTIFVRDGVYSEQLPITVPANTAIMGDSQRTVVVQPAGGNDDTGTKLNSESTMFYVSDGVLLKQMTFVGMTGFVPGSPDDDITAATVGGVFVRFNPSSPITTKSPYILECSAISNGGIGVIVDGSIHATGNKSMVFHAYTNLNNDGVGYWVKDNGRAEIVSCFSYYCWFGLATSGGGFIRGLNNNNSYGRYGAVSRGYDTIETPHTGKLYGSQLQFAAGSTMAFNVGEFITGGTSSANGIVTNVQGAADKLYYWPVSGTFQNSEVVTGVTTTTTATVTSSGVTGQKGYVVVANQFNDEPKPGRSIQFADDANNAYVIQSVSGTYVDTNSRMIIVLSQEKTTPSSNAANVVIRANFSQIRLTGHDFLDIGTGNTATANVPGVPSLPASQANEVVEYKPGRVYYVSTDQNGNFRVGEYFRIDQATGRATLDASAFDLAGLTSLKLGSIGAQLGETINEFSSDVTMGGDSNQAVPTEHAVKYYTDNKFVQLNAASQTITGNVAIAGNLTVVGGATQISANNLLIGDSLIYLAANNYSGTDLLDIGFVANYGNTTGANVHTGFVRDATNKQYYLFQGYDAEPANNTFVPGGNNMVNAVLVADINTSNLTLGGANAITWINSAYETANSAYANSVPFASVNGSLFLSNTTGKGYWKPATTVWSPNLTNSVNNYIAYFPINGSNIALFRANNIFNSSSFTFTAYNLPSGLSFTSNVANATLVNSSYAGGQNVYSILISATDGNWSSGNTEFILNIDPFLPAFSNYVNNGLPSGTLYVNSNYSYDNFKANSYSGNVTHTLTSGSLPPGFTLSSNGTVTGTTGGSVVGSTAYNFTVTANNGSSTASQAFSWTVSINIPVGQAQFTTAGTYTWTAPSGVTWVSAVAIGGGGGGASGWANPGGHGGGLGWRDCIPVTPGTSYTVTVGCGGPSGPNYQCQGGSSCFAGDSGIPVVGGGAGSSTFGCVMTYCSCCGGGGYCGDCGGRGGFAGDYAGGGGAGGYCGAGGGNQSYGCIACSGSGGAAGGGYYSSTYGTGAGGGTGIFGKGQDGCLVYSCIYGCINCWSGGWGGMGGSGGGYGRNGETQFGGQGYGCQQICGGLYGGGGGGPGTSCGGGPGASGAVRIIWGCAGRSFSCCTFAQNC